MANIRDIKQEKATGGNNFFLLIDDGISNKKIKESNLLRNVDIVTKSITLTEGSINFEAQNLLQLSGPISVLTNMPAPETQVAGNEVSYSLNIDNNVIAKVYAETDGNDGTQNRNFYVNGFRVLTTDDETSFISKDGDTMIGDLTIEGTLYATSKSFRIPHPTKSNKKLTYASIEAPENAVMVRGRTLNEYITLPNYWGKLIDSGTITVQLTANNFKQKLIVVETNEHFIRIKNKNLFNKKINCFYTIYAERKDIPKLEVES